MDLLRQADRLASACRVVDLLGICPANLNPSFWCPLGDDGICENVTSEDWLLVLKQVEDTKK